MTKAARRLMAWLRSLHMASLAEAAEKRKAMIERESKHAVQVREFDGDIYICLNGVPLIKGDSICGDIVTAVEESREAWMTWREKEAEHGRR